MTRRLQVLDPGPLALIQDAGRIGHLAVGAGRAGAADLASYQLGNRLVGNRKRSASIEVTFGGLRLRAHGDLLLCLTGAAVPARAGGREVGHAAPFTLRDGDELHLGAPRAGLRTYVSVRGGIDVPAELGSRAADTMSGLGPAPLCAGDELPVAPTTKRWPGVDVAPVAPPSTGVVRLRVTAGPRRDWFADHTELAGIDWTTSERSDRKGVRLVGGALQRVAARRETELPSEGMVRGAIQVPPNGEPVIFLNDFPVTGGYPVIGVVRLADVDLAAQLTPGQGVRFIWED